MSVYGQRRVDDGGPTAPQPGWAPTAAVKAKPGRGFAIASFVLGLCSIIVGWIPFLFVLAVGGAITALVFAVIGIRRARQADGYGMGFAVAGAVLAPIALGVCVVGFLLTRAVLDEVNDFVDPGRHDLVQNQPCDVVDGVATFTGTITNLEANQNDYTLNVVFIDDSPAGSQRRLAVDSVVISDVDPGDSREWQSVRLVGKMSPVRCEVTEVFGPTPFGLDQQRIESP